MIDKFKKYFKTAEAATQEEEVNMEQTAPLAATELSTDLTDKLAQAQAALTEQANTFAELAAKFEAATAELAAIKEAKAQAEASALEAKLTARKEKIVAAVGTDKAEALLAATQGVDDAQFSAIVEAFDAKLVSESQSAMFTEVGADGEVDVAKAEESPEMKALKAKYSAKA